ncbi:transcription factor A, mitochondrial [Malaya genurostris]|uniref:transcription factor A, mitochondrial n=1 Tax=Malaya genurostris TaxID=325434 RepID=UPI0026F3F2A3|nr:transcription factor A, mitochondrial [Malaya genurostris]
MMQIINLVRSFNIVGHRPIFTAYQLNCGFKTSHHFYDPAGAASTQTEKPKRPLNTFIRFAQSVRPSLLAKHPNATPAEISKMAAAQWQVLDAASKSKLTEAYKKEQEVWLMKNAKYLNQLTDQQKDEIRQARLQKQEDKDKREHRKRVKELGRPKRPLNGYLLYCAEHKTTSMSREENKTHIKKMAEVWGKLSEAEKQPYNQRAADALVKFHDDLSKWEEKMMSQDNMDVVRRKSIIIPPKKGTNKSNNSK